MAIESAFLSGLREGLTAPFALFGSPREPNPVEPFGEIKTNIGNIASDWGKLGGDMSKAMGYVAASAASGRTA